MREEAKVLANSEVGAGYRLLRLFSPGSARRALPGQFVHVRVPSFDPFALRRPLSVCFADPASGTLEILYKIVGRGTEALAKAREGVAVDLMGPLGKPFPRPARDVRPVLVGGGYGVAPLYFLAASHGCAAGDGAASGEAGRPVLFVGARTAADLMLLDRFEALGVEVHAATDDGSAGVRGLVTAALDAWLARCEAQGGGPSPQKLAFYACGPAPMLRAVEERALARREEAWLSLDRRMACGVGTCFGCTQRVREADGSEAVARVCADGPVFPAGRIIWGD